MKKNFMMRVLNRKIQSDAWWVLPSYANLVPDFSLTVVATVYQFDCFPTVNACYVANLGKAKISKEAPRCEKCDLWINNSNINVYFTPELKNTVFWLSG